MTPCSSDRQSRVSMVDEAMEPYRRRRFLEAVDAAYTPLRQNAETWRAIEQERSEWDAALGEGLPVTGGMSLLRRWPQSKTVCVSSWGCSLRGLLDTRLICLVTSVVWSRQSNMSRLTPVLVQGNTPSKQGHLPAAVPSGSRLTTYPLGGVNATGTKKLNFLDFALYVMYRNE